jgi:hypothetical protein
MFLCSSYLQSALFIDPSLSWSRVPWPLHHGGLGISDLKLMGITPRARWLWLHRTEQHRSWVSLPITVDDDTRAFFDASVQFVLSDGTSFLFLSDP